MTDRRADSGRFVGCDRSSDARSTNHYAAFCLTRSDARGNPFSYIRKIYRLGAVASNIGDGVSQALDKRHQFSFHWKACVVGANGNIHINQSLIRN